MPLAIETPQYATAIRDADARTKAGTKHVVIRTPDTKDGSGQFEVMPLGTEGPNRILYLSGGQY